MTIQIWKRNGIYWQEFKRENKCLCDMSIPIIFCEISDQWIGRLDDEFYKPLEDFKGNFLLGI